MKKLTINLDTLSYDIIIENGLIDNLGNYLDKLYQNKNVYIITDDIVSKLYLARVKKALINYNVKEVIIPHGEDSKSINVLTSTCERLLELDIKRNELLIALGGGVVGDLCGFVSSILYRGIPYIGIPTTLLSQVDSSIGGKTGIDFCNRKNILGAFKQPLGVFIDPLTLNSLDEREFNNGMGELIKHGAIGNINLLKLLEEKPLINENIIYESLLVKKAAVEKDVYDQKERMTLNFGHTFGHVLELKLKLKHGEAVALGMLMAIRLGIDLGVTEEGTYATILNILIKYNLPHELYDYKKYLKDIVYDKKNLAGTINFILLSKAGECIIYKVKECELKQLTK